MSNYNYPIEPFWSRQEMLDVIDFFSKVEAAYESSVDREELLAAYNTFKKIVPAKSEEKTMFRNFQEQSSYSSYHAVKEARSTKKDRVSL